MINGRLAGLLINFKESDARAEVLKTRMQDFIVFIGPPGTH